MTTLTTAVHFDQLVEDKNLMKHVLLWLKKVYPQAGNHFPTLKRINSEMFAVVHRNVKIGVIRKSNFQVELINDEYHGKITVSTKTTPWGIVVRGVKATTKLMTVKPKDTQAIYRKQVDRILWKVYGVVALSIAVIGYMSN